MWKNNPEATDLRSIKQNVYQNTPTIKFNRQEQIIITRLRIEHTTMTHQHLLKKGDPQKCNKCKKSLM